MMKRFFTVMLSISLLAMPAYAEFSDTKGHWAQESIAEIFNQGFISGYPDGSFRPDSSISRAEAAKILSFLYDAPSEDFSDVEPSEWYYDFIKKVGALFYTADKSFMPNEYITRQDAVYCIVRAIFGDKSDYGEKPLEYFKDGYLVSDYARQYVAYAKDAGLIAGYPDGTIKATAPLSRAEFAVMLVKAQTAAKAKPNETTETDEPQNDIKAEKIRTFVPVTGVSKIKNENGTEVMLLNCLSDNEIHGLITSEYYTAEVHAGDTITPLFNTNYLVKDCKIIARASNGEMIFDSAYMGEINGKSSGKIRYYYGEIAEISRGKNISLKPGALSRGTYSDSFNINGNAYLYVYIPQRSSKNKLFSDSLSSVLYENGSFDYEGELYTQCYIAAREIDGTVTDAVIYLMN